MNTRGWGHTESSRLAIAALCAVAMHVSLACLPVQWRPILPTPTILRVTLAPPTPTPAPPVPQPPITPVATVTAAPEAPVQATLPPSPEPPVQTAAIARPPAPPKIVQPLPKPKRPPEPRKPPLAVQSAPTLPQPKAPKPTEQPRVIVAKTPAKAPAQRTERSRPVVAKPLTPQAMDSESGNDGGRTPRSYRKAWDDDFDTAPSAGRLADRITKPAESGSGVSASAASASPARVATLATSLRPLPGNPKPRYPEQLRQRGIEGQVLVRLTVSAAGSVESASVARSSGNDLLDQEARATVLRWRFQPLEGPKVAQLPITFRLQN